MRRALLVVLALTAPARADEPAQAADAITPAASSPDPAPTQKPGIDPRSDAAWQLYHVAFGALASGDRAQADAILARLRREYPDHPATMLAGGALEPSQAPGAPRIEIHHAAASNEDQGSSARAELAVFQSMHGIAIATELCIIAKCNDGSAAIGLALVGGGVGAAASLSIGEITPGKRAAINSGTFWGAYNAVMFVVAQSGQSDQAVAGEILGGQIVGLGLGVAISNTHASAGQVALANSGGQWAFALGLLGWGIARGPGSQFENWAIPIAIATDAGIATGAYLGHIEPQVSRGQTYAIDAGALLGGLGGGALGAIISGKIDNRATYGLSAAGLVGGIAGAAYLTRNWGNDDAAGVSTIIVPTPGGAQIAARVSW